MKVLEYQTQQWRLFPQLSKAFAFLFAGNYVRDLYYSVFKDVGPDQVSVTWQSTSMEFVEAR